MSRAERSVRSLRSNVTCQIFSGQIPEDGSPTLVASVCGSPPRKPSSTNNVSGNSGSSTMNSSFAASSPISGERSRFPCGEKQCRPCSARPYFDRASSVIVGGDSVEVVPYQLVLWVAFASVGDDKPPKEPRLFPAVLDTGFSGTFAITTISLAAMGRCGVERVAIRPKPQTRVSRCRGSTPPGERLDLPESVCAARPDRSPCCPVPTRTQAASLSTETACARGRRDRATCRTAAAAYRPPGDSVARLRLEVDAAARQVWLDSP